jgi:hypothetical protein
MWLTGGSGCCDCSCWSERKNEGDVGQHDHQLNTGKAAGVAEEYIEVVATSARAAQAFLRDTWRDTWRTTPD